MESSVLPLYNFLGGWPFSDAAVCNQITPNEVEKTGLPPTFVSELLHAVLWPVREGSL